MADATERDEAARELETMTKKIQDVTVHRKEQFTVDEVVSLIGGWVRVSMLMRGRDILKSLRPQLLKKGEAGKGTAGFTRAGELYADLNVYKNKIKDGSDTAAPYTQALQSTLNFLYEYRKRLKPSSKEDQMLELKLTTMLNNVEKS